MPKPLRLGTRRSPLALAQAEEARDRLCAAQGWTPEQVEIVPVIATGDRIQDRPLAEIGGKALWTKELDAALLSGEIDFAVHSAKDVETLRPAEIAIAAVLPREDVRDVLVGAESIAALPLGARIGTSAPRRAAQLLHLRPDCVVVPFRGNVATRLAKLEAGEADATLLAKAGLNRLGHGDIGHPIGSGRVLYPPVSEDWLPAPGQGAIAIECRANDATTRDILLTIDDFPSRATLLAERRLLEVLGGNCHSPIAVISELDGETIRMSAAVFSPDGSERVDAGIYYQVSWKSGPSALAEELLEGSSEAIRAQFTAFLGG